MYPDLATRSISKGKFICEIKWTISRISWGGVVFNWDNGSRRSLNFPNRAAWVRARCLLGAARVPRGTPPRSTRDAHDTDVSTPHSNHTYLNRLLLKNFLEKLLDLCTLANDVQYTHGHAHTRATVLSNIDNGCAKNVPIYTQSEDGLNIFPRCIWMGM